MKRLSEKCRLRDYSFVEMARQRLNKPNKFICICCHCWGQAIKEEDIKHTKECCLKLSTH